MPFLDKRAVQSCASRGDGLIEIASFIRKDGAYRLDCLTKLDGIADAEDDWRSLERASGESFIYFQSFDWCYRWCVQSMDRDISARSPQPSIFTLRRDGELVMIWPMMLVRSRIGLRILTFLTEPLSQYANVIVNRELISEKFGREIWRLIRKKSKVDAILVSQYPKGSFLDLILGGDGIKEKSSREASILDLTTFETWEEHHALLSRSVRKQRNKRRNKLAREGEVGYAVHPGGSQQYKDLVKLALEMKRVWLVQTGRRSSTLANKCTIKFLSSLTGSQSGSKDRPQGAVAHALMVNDRPVAIELGMILGGHYYSYLGAFSWNWRDYSPGKIQIEAAQKWAKEAGLEKFDFLGDPSAYKSNWTDVSRQLVSRSVPTTALGLLYCVIWKTYLKPTLKAVYGGMGSEKRKLLLRLCSSCKMPLPPASTSKTSLGSSM